MTVVREQKEKNTNTEKETTDPIRIAVYGSLRKGLSNHGIISDEKLVGTFDSKPVYTMYSVHEYYPALMTDGLTSVKMEVYEITEEAFDKVNRLEGYISEGNRSNLYNRESIDTPYGKAFVYIYNQSIAGLHAVSSGDWKKYKKVSQLVNEGASC